MADDKKLYLKMVRVTEEVVNSLIAAQRECEELYISSPEPELTAIAFSAEHKDQTSGEL